MEGAIKEYREAVEAGQNPKLRFLARAWNMPKSTLERRVNGKISGSKYASGRKPYLSEAAEKELASKNAISAWFPLGQERYSTACL